MIRRAGHLGLLAVLFLSLTGAELQSGASADKLTIDPVSKAARVTPYASDAKDATATKVFKVYSALNFTAATTEALVTLTPAADWVDGSTGTSFTITAGKRLVIIGMSCVTKNAGAAVQGVITRIRVSGTGAVTTASSTLAVCGAGTYSAIANVVGSLAVPVSAGWPTHIELSGTNQIGISQIGTATAGNDVVVWGYEY